MTICLTVMSKGTSPLSKAAFKKIKGYPLIIWAESIANLNSKQIMSLLSNYHKDFPASLIELCIINLPENMQLIATDKYKDKLASDEMMLQNFYYAVSSKTKERLKKYFPDRIEDDILLELEDLKEEDLITRLSSDYERLAKQSSDDLIEFILLKATRTKTLSTFLELFNDKVNDCSIFKFQLLVTRYRYIRDGNVAGHFDSDGTWFWYDEDKQKKLTDEELFRLFKDKFRELGIQQTLSLFGHNNHTYSINNFNLTVILEFMDIAYANLLELGYVNTETTVEIINRFEERCRSKNYSIEDFERLVRNIGKSEKNKLISDDYIEAIIACGNLLNAGLISDQHPLFLELREKFSSYLLKRVERDGTYTKDVSLNGIFYRLATGKILYEDICLDGNIYTFGRKSISFDKIYLTKTYRGLIYLSKCGEATDRADYITKFLTDEQIAKLNIKPVLRWKNSLRKENLDENDIAFTEKMGLQLLCYFGINKAKYLLDSGMKKNRMENLFDGLQYKDISINEDGTPNTNEELINYLFGWGMMQEPNSVINKMIRQEIPEFQKFFTKFCNSFEKIKQECKGVFSIKRIIRCLDNIALPIELKPDEKMFEDALSEVNDYDPNALKKAISLCKDARKRRYSSIPKVEGQIGGFTYEVLDLDDPMAVAVGHLSHCCFIINGLSYSSLKHSMQSVNGRTFVVYYNGQFLTQSWLWRNGDVICFDSVEAGALYHGMYKDDIELVDVYKQAAREILQKSEEQEDDIQKVKVVTVGKQDYQFEGLKRVKGELPSPLEKGLYIYDSRFQQILAGSMPNNPRYGIVSAKYKDQRKEAIILSDTSNTDIDTIDEVMLNINSLRYQLTGEETPADYLDYTKIISGDGWYILINHDNTVESGALTDDEDTTTEYKKYLSKYTDNVEDGKKPLVKSMLTTGKNKG